MKNKNALFECTNCGMELGPKMQSHLNNTADGEQVWSCNALRHTPIPWTKESSLFREPCVIGIYGNNLKKTIAKWTCTTQQDAEQMHEDAAFIVKAVNCHEELLEALRYLTKEIHLGKLNVRKDFSLINAHACALKAIAKAEGK